MRIEDSDAASLTPDTCFLMNILGIETSCDETSAAVVADGYRALSNVVATQTDLHRAYGGVVPEIASRSHVETLPRVIEQAVRMAGVGWDGIDMIAVTYGPGLASSLLVGLSAAKALALRLGKPMRGVNHLEGHIFSAFLSAGALSFEKACPFVALVVSGGHTCLARARAMGHYTLLGQTVDDAAGEAFDKGASLLGLGYPGGPAVERASAGGRADHAHFPRGRPRKLMGAFDGLNLDLCFSFSGLKTALLYYLRAHPLADDAGALPAIAASYQEAIVDAVADRCRRALKDERILAVGGGVSLNRRLREKLTALANEVGARLLLSDPAYCADNAAMIAGAAGLGAGIGGGAAFELDACPSLGIG
ncbi:MAG: tRNA (adenosine(37)-N6)-threonylcarbamoyltransferase complex transferase subunit TsaD [Verrucomicrobiota bacterium]|nr:tRNA (adenosine(37)-N6)-threonylcarbamoyltransferase complex transferase subunit TsaD [Verrucomicrobiota bacterium]